MRASRVTIDRALTEDGDTLILPCEVNYIYIINDEDVQEAVTEILSKLEVKDPAIAVDLETTGFDPYTCDIVLLQIGTADNTQYIFDYRSITPDLLKPVLSGSARKLGHNIKFDAKFIKHKLGVSMTNLYDTFIAEKVIRGGSYAGGEGYGLDQVLKRRLGLELRLDAADHSESSSKTDRVKKTMQMSFISWPKGKPFSLAQLAYAAQDVSSGTIFALAQQQVATLCEDGPNSLYDEGVSRVSDQRIRDEYEEIFPKYKSLWPTACLEFKFIEVLVDLELEGMGFSKVIHQEVLKNIVEDYSGFRKDFLALLSNKTVQKTLFGTAGINPDSNLQVLEELNNLGLDLPDTNSKNLEVKLSEIDKDSLEGRVLSCLLNYRASAKLVSSYGESLAEHIHLITGRIHCSVQQVIDTGRVSTSTPNIQQIPGRMEWRKTGDAIQDAVIDARSGLRDCFQARPGNRLVIFDYSAQELRIAASIALENTMLNAFIDGKDLHCVSATLMFNVNYDEFYKKYKEGDKVAKQQRNIAKVVSFGSLYGSGPPNLAKTLNISLEEAKDILEKFWGAYPGLKHAMTRYGDLAYKYGYSNTVLGRRRYYTDILQKIRHVELAQGPEALQALIVSNKIFWFIEKHGKVSFENIKQAKFALINKLKGQIARQAGNMGIQGAAADMVKLASVYIRNEYLKKNIDAKIVGLIHDEIITECKTEDAQVCYDIMDRNMKKALNLFCPNVPAEVEGHISECWKK